MTDLLYPTCGEKCRWWGIYEGCEYCCFDIELIPAITGRRACHHWGCAACGGDWEDEYNHEDCMVIEFIPEGG